jgi:multidrug efflux system membrane fusion protein
LYIWAGILISALVLCSCTKNDSEAPKSGKGAKGDRAVPVTSAPVQVKDVPVQIRDIGSVEAYATVQVKTQVDGTISKVFFKPGDDVKQNQVLFTIDPRPFIAELQQAQANFNKDLITAKNAKVSAQRSQTLHAQGSVALEESQASATSAEAAAAAAEADQAAVESARLKVSYTTVTAPIAGRAGDISIDAGNVVKANDAPLVTIVQLQPIYVTFSVPETSLQQIRHYQAIHNLEVDIVVPGSNEETAKGELTFINNTVDKTAGTVLLKATFKNENLRLWPGQFVNIALTVTTLKNAVVVPSEAIQTGQQGSYLFVMKPDKSVEMRPVTSGQTFRGETVIDKGLSGHETVITDGQLQLVNGTKVLPTLKKNSDDDTTSTANLQTQQPSNERPAGSKSTVRKTSATINSSKGSPPITRTPVGAYRNQGQDSQARP